MATKRKKKSAPKRATKAAPTKAATKKGAKRGRKPDASSKSGKIRELLQAGVKPMEIAKQVGCTSGLVYQVRLKMQGGGGRKRKTAASKKAKAAKAVKIEGLDGVLAAVRKSQQDSERMRAALVKIQAVLADALR